MVIPCFVLVGRPSNLGIEWNAENQLKKVLKNAATIATFAYDPAGRRVEKVAGGTTTTFTYDAEDILREIAGATTTYYAHGPGIDEPLAKEISGSLTYYHADGLGSILKVSNATGSVTHEYRYDTYGRIEAGSTQAGYSFTGREWDPENGLYYYRARYYDPSMGRFISEDPIGLIGGINLQAYVRNNPSTLVDPTGTVWWVPAILLALAYVFNNPTNANVTEGPTVSPIVSNTALTLVILGAATICYGRTPAPVGDEDDVTLDWNETPEQPPDYDRVWQEELHRLMDERGGDSTANRPDGTLPGWDPTLTPDEKLEETIRNTRELFDEVDRRVQERMKK